MTWVPAGKDCGACGVATCERFLSYLERGEKSYDDCPYYDEQESGRSLPSVYTGTDVLGYAYDFVLRPLPGEPSARKYIVPFRADLVERWNISPGELVLGRPAGPGCPLYHALRVLSANPITGVLECHTLGPLAARKEDAHDVQAYHVHAFEGLAEVIHNEPVLGKRHRFLPGYCMLGLSHTAVVNTVLKKSGGVHVRLEDIRIL
ncbi:MAG: (Fe-S)-binding protein [Halobacteriota archaeon]